MDRRLLPYVTFLQENGAAPFAEYILCRELLENAEEAEAAYAWATLFPLYDDLVGEQREDGSWGAYLSADTATSKNCKYKTTARAFMRIRDLALPADDPAVVRARALLHRYLSGETPLPDTMSPRNFTQRAAIRRQALFDLAPCEPADDRVRAFRALLAERVEYACASGRFDRERFRAAGVEEPLRPGETTNDILPLLAAGGEDGCEVHVGQQLTRGSVNPHDLLRLTDPNTTLRYIVGQVQGVYVSQGVDINDKHIEVIARQMLRKVAVLDSGDSDFLPGRQVNRFEFEKVANDLIAEGKEPPVGQPLLLGITKASLATDSWLSAASFQETTKVLTDAAIESKTDHLVGLKENVIIGKPIPAGTGLNRYHDVKLTYKGRSIEDHVEGEQLPDYAPDALRDIEELLPQPQDWSLDGEGYLNMGGGYGGYYSGMSLGHRGPQLSDEEARLYIYDDLGVSQRWANKFSEAGIETVADLVGHTEEDLLRIEGIGAKAIEELKEGLAERGLSRVIEDDLSASSDDMSQLLDMVFSPDDNILIGGDEPPTFNTEGEEMLGEALPPRSYQRNIEELDALLGSVGSLGFGITTKEDEEASNAADEDDEQ